MFPLSPYCVLAVNHTCIGLAACLSTHSMTSGGSLGSVSDSATLRAVVAHNSARAA